jgi:hypothetical protein
MRDSGDDLQPDQGISQEPQAPARAPFRWRAAGHGDQVGFLLPIQLPSVHPLGQPPLEGSIQSLGHVLLAPPRDRTSADRQRTSDGGVIPARTTFPLVSLQQDARVGEFPGRSRPGPDQAGAVPAPIRVRRRARSTSLRQTASFAFIRCLRVLSVTPTARRLHQQHQADKSVLTDH